MKQRTDDKSRRFNYYSLVTCVLYEHTSREVDFCLWDRQESFRSHVKGHIVYYLFFGIVRSPDIDHCEFLVSVIQAFPENVEIADTFQRQFQPSFPVKILR